MLKKRRKIQQTSRLSPAAMTIAGFLGLIAAGTFMLMLPCAAPAPGLKLIEAFFTATSAVCVTGLSVIDAGTGLTLFGQAVLLFLIQAGGLGIMTLSTLVILLAGKRAGLGSRNILQDTYTGSGKWSSRRILRQVVLITMGIELAGAAVMFPKFLETLEPAKAAWYALFHSVSAFCNAGFALFPDSLSAYIGEPVVNVTVIFLIIGGGMGFLVITEVWETLKSGKLKFSRLSLHTKLALSATLVLLLTGTFIFLVMERGNTLAGLPLGEKCLASLFQSVTTRTAGFNTVDTGALTNESLSLFMLFMFIGACPGSCAGGIKATTAGALLLLGISRIKGKEEPEVFGRTIPAEDINRAANILMLGMGAVIIGAMVLFMTEAQGISKIDGHAGFAEIVFETVSAFGTAGLSMGITADFSISGKLVLCAIMFIGRLGPLFMGAALVRHSPSRIRYARENIMTG
ncbi:MAG: potassium-transporting ATPase subunit KdpA [Desulfobacter sp.]|nr:MAG: potassium-transporting ATPase subunit KdpA [Desulfobacter sp.]